MFKVVPEVPKPLLIFLNSCFFNYNRMFISSFWSKSLIWVLVSFPSLLVPCTFPFIPLFTAFTFSSILQPYSIILWASWLPVFWTLPLIGWLSFCHLVVFFLELWSVLSLGPLFLVLTHLLCSKGRSLRYSPAQGNSLCCVVALYVGEGSERELHLLLGFWPAFSNFFSCPQVNRALLVLIPRWVGLCML